MRARAKHPRPPHATSRGRRPSTGNHEGMHDSIAGQLITHLHRVLHPDTGEQGEQAPHHNPQLPQRRHLEISLDNSAVGAFTSTHRLQCRPDLPRRRAESIPAQPGNAQRSYHRQASQNRLNQAPVHPIDDAAYSPWRSAADRRTSAASRARRAAWGSSCMAAVTIAPLAIISNWSANASETEQSARRSAR